MFRDMKQKVMIPRFIDYDDNLKYFIPRFAKIQKGETVEWTNLDIKPHTLVFYRIQGDWQFLIGRLGPIGVNESKSMTFDYESSRVDYHCEIHSSERGSVLILPKNEEHMSNTETLKFLQQMFDITPIRH
jgi:plastocyanin